MSGLKSRNKGKRVELELVHLFKSMGYASQRIPLSGATTYAKGDVELVRNGIKESAEVKSRAFGFKNIYKVLDEAKDLGFNLVDTNNVIMSYLFDQVFAAGNQGLHRNELQLDKQLETLKKLKVGCKYLVLKANHKPFIFIRWLDDVD